MIASEKNVLQKEAAARAMDNKLSRAVMANDTYPHEWSAGAMILIHPKQPPERRYLSGSKI